MVRRVKKFFSIFLSITFLGICTSCSENNDSSKDNSSESSQVESVQEYENITINESLFIANDVPIVQDRVGEFSGVKIGYPGVDYSYGIYGKQQEDFEVEIDRTFTTTTRLEYIFAKSQWCVTEFIVCNASGQKLFGIVRDWIALSQLEFYDVGYIIDYRQTPNLYYAQGNSYTDIYEALSAKHLCIPKYNNDSKTGWFSVEVISGGYLKISTSVDETSHKPLEQIFKYDLKDGFRIKICDGRQRTLDYIEESGTVTMREYRTCVLLTALTTKKHN